MTGGQTILAAILGVAGVLAILFSAEPKKKPVDVHVISESNIICMTYKDTMQCFPYADEGTTLYVEPVMAK